VKEICEKFEAKVFTKILDVTNKKDCLNYIEEISKNYDLDLVIANAGISAGTAQGSESFEQINKIFDVNINGVLNIIHPAIDKMLKKDLKEKDSKERGQIAIISSLAGFRGLPSSPSYSASKAAVRVYGEALRGNLSKFGIKVNVICPGYVKTPMTDVNKFPMPFLISAEKCAKEIRAGLRKNKSRIAFPFPLFFVVWFCALLSNKITDPIFSRLPGKESLD
jgi:short-subunit dehydrogenase